MRKKIFLIGIVVLLLLSSFSTYIFADDVEEKTIEFLINEEEIKEGYLLRRREEVEEEN